MRILLSVIEEDIRSNLNFTFYLFSILELSEWTNLSFSFACSYAQASHIGFHTCAEGGWVIVHEH